MGPVGIHKKQLYLEDQDSKMNCPGAFRYPRELV
jgi:hypothetical protein